MADASFMQTSFLGGMWSGTAQGRMLDPEYKRALTEFYNSLPLEPGAWTRRPGFVFLAHTRSGQAAKLVPFDFSTEKPYQAELTNLVMRLFADRALVTVPNEGITVASISTANPGVVHYNGSAAAWSNGVTVIFGLNSLPCTAPYLCNRQFVIANLNTGAGTFTLKDAITGADIDGADIAYQTPVGDPDDILRVFEMTTPYTTTDLPSVRYTQSETELILLHTGYISKVVSQSAPFAIADADFVDGPYLDINDTATTLTPSATSGSVTLTASSTTGINSGQGFLTTDVGRLVRLRGQPASWSNATTYAKNNKVLGSDSNIYTSIKGGNLNHDPTTDDGTNWQITAEDVTWTWGKITARADATHVTLLIKGTALPATTATTAWRLGLFCDTLGWPTCGTFHEGRLWLSGVVGNRIDASKSNKTFDFSPTATDGTVADDNAIAATMRSKEVNAILWMRSDDDGLYLGTQAAEWRIRASTNDDPIAPANIQARIVSKYGSADIEPVEPSTGRVFIQRQKRRVLLHRPLTLQKFTADHVSRDAFDLTVGGIEEIAWQQEPVQTIWMRRADGTLVGCTHKQGDTKEDSFSAFHYHGLANGRIVTSISTGPAYDGLSDTLFIVSNQTNITQPDNNIHWVQAMYPVFDAAQEDWAAFYVDGGGNPCCVKELSTTLGDSINGLRIYGLWHLNGVTLTPVVGGLDLGDYVVANGYIDVEFGGIRQPLFTKAFFDALNDGTDYGIFGVRDSSTAVLLLSAVAPANSIGAYVGSTTNFTDQTVKFVYQDLANNRVFMTTTDTSSTGGIRRFDALTTYTEQANKSDAQIFGAGNHLAAYRGCYHPGNNSLFFFLDGTAHSRLARVDADTLMKTGLFGYSDAVLTGSSVSGLALGGFGILPLSIGDKNYVVTVGTTAAFSNNEVALTDADLLQYKTKIAVAETQAYMCRGYERSSSQATFFVVGENDASRPSTASFKLYKYTVTKAGAMTKTLVGSVSPTDVDATWTNISAISGPLYDEIDGNIVIFVSTLDAVANKNYIVKINHSSGAVMYAGVVPFTDAASIVTPGVGTQVKLTSQRYILYRSASNTAYNFNLADGSHTTYANFSPIMATSTSQTYDDSTGSVLLAATWNWSPSDPNFLGTWMIANGSTPEATYRISRLFFGWGGGSNSSATWEVPLSIGTAFESRGQLLRPDYGIDAGARNGPAFGKKRRLHQWAAQFLRAREVEIGTDFVSMYPVKLQDAKETDLVAPALYSGVTSDTIECDYSFDGQIAWRCQRPYPCTVAAFGGYIQSMDK